MRRLLWRPTAGAQFLGNYFFTHNGTIFAVSLFIMTINVNLHIHHHGADSEQLTRIENKLIIMANELETLTTEVSETKTVMASAVTLLQGLKQKLDEAGTDATKLAALSAELDSSTNDLAAAITANTPAATETPATPES